MHQTRSKTQLLKKKIEVRILFDYDKIVLTKNDASVGNDYYNQGLNVSGYQ